MKLEIRILCIGLVLAFLFTWNANTSLAAFGCNESFVNQEGIIFTVLPTGTNDTVNIQCAFDAAVDTGSGSVVKLVSGTYYIDRDIVVVNFDGTFTGAGKDNTYVQNIDLDPFPPHGDPFPYQFMSGLFGFYQDENAIQSSISISDLTFRAIGSGTWVNIHGGFEHNMMNILEIFGKITGIQDDEVYSMNTSLIRVGFEGQSGDWVGGANVLNGVFIAGEQFMEPCGDSMCVDYFKQLSGTHIVQDCTFKNTLTAYGVVNSQDTIVNVENSTFEDNGHSIRVLDFSNSTINIQNNTVHNAKYFGVWLVNGYQAVLGWDLGPHGNLPLPSSVNFSHNEISVIDTGDGIGIEDYGFVQNQSTFEDVIISQNKIILDGSFYGGLWGYGISGVVFKNNKITGTGAYGVYVDGWNSPISNWILVGNNFETVNTSWPTIILGPLTSNFTIVGGRNINNVLDLGTDNIITGVNVTSDSDLGKIISDVMSDRRFKLIH